MGVYIKGMKMPKSCCDCPLGFSINFGVICTATGTIVDDNHLLNDAGDEIRQSWCPLIKVPPHGRLGDLDKLEQMFVDIDNAPYSEFDGEEPFYTAEDAAQIIRLSPTIIEREDGT